MAKLIFGFPLNEEFEIAKDVYHSIKKFNHDPLVLYAGNRGIGDSIGNLMKFPSRREYKIRLMQNFMFDMIETIKDMDFDYFIKIDSDSLFANYGFEKIFEREFDFCAQTERDDALRWDNGIRFFDSLDSYLELLGDLGLKRKDRTIAGAMCCLQIYSKRTVTFLAQKIDKIEASKGYAGLVHARDTKNLALSDTFLPTLLKDAGFHYIPNPYTLDLQGDTGHVRWRPYWKIREIENMGPSELAVLYHPVRRDFNDPFRRYIVDKVVSER